MSYEKWHLINNGVACHSKSCAETGGRATSWTILDATLTMMSSNLKIFVTQGLKMVGLYPGLQKGRKSLL